MKEMRTSRYLKDKEGYFSEEQIDRTKKRSREMEETSRARLTSQKVRAKTLTYFDEVMRYDGARSQELSDFQGK